MKILYVDLATTIGGSLVSLEQLLKRLDRNGCEPLALLSECSPAIADYRALQVPVLTVPVPTTGVAGSTGVVGAVKRSGVGRRLRSGRHLSRVWAWGRGVRNTLRGTLPLVWRIYRVIRAVGPDLVHANDALFVSRPAIAAAWLARTPVVCHVRSLGRLQFWDRLWARTVRGLIFISRWVEADQAGQGVSTARGRVIYNAVDLALFDHVPDRQAARAALGLPADRPIVAVMGRVVPWKGQDLFIRAMRQVVDSVPLALGLVVGEGDSFDPDFGLQLRALTSELTLEQAVRFTGHIADVPTVMAAVDVLAHTSVSPEPFGRVLIEAMAAGRPVVTPAEGGGLEVVLDGTTGLHYEPRNPAALAQAILRLLSDPGLAQELGMAGRERVAAQFGLERLASEVVAFYREVL